jgi:UDP-N-acetylglucosamine 2-epimerase (non-hydrolysing)
MHSKTILISVGTRPELIKLAPLIRALQARPGVEPYVVFTAQHRGMLDQMAEFFGIVPDEDLNMMRPGQSLAAVGSRMLASLDEVIGRVKPDVVVGQGDTSTCLMTAMAAFYQGVPFAHVEAGLRSGDPMLPFPEEAHRRAVAPLASWHFAPTVRAGQNLLAEGVAPERVFVTGNTGLDALMETAARDALWLPESLVKPLRYARRVVLVTMHRRESFGEAMEGMFSVIRAMSLLFPEVMFVWPVHPNPQVQERVHQALSGLHNVLLTEPLGYGELVAVLRRAELVMTDSGGLQEEAAALHIPTLVLREQTERVEGLEAGCSELVGTRSSTVLSRAVELLTDPSTQLPMRTALNPYGDGQAAERIVDALLHGHCREFRPRYAPLSGEILVDMDEPASLAS